MKIIWKAKYFLISVMIIVAFFLLRNNEVKINMEKPSLEKIKMNNIFFGHRSVGENIIQGMKNLNTNHEIEISKFQNINQINSNYFVDANIGYNGDPQSKFNEFSEIVTSLAKGKNLNIAMMKLCYADITKETDINQVFRNYVLKIDSLKSKFPNLHIVHFTVPLTAEQTLIRKIKSFIKGTSKNNSLNNAARTKYNELLYAYYRQQQIFDLAKIESTYQNGEREEGIVNDNHYFSLVNDYTVDGGHLNEVGRKIVATKLIKYLSAFIDHNEQNIISKK